LGTEDERLYASKAYANDVALGVRTVKFDAGDSMPLRTVFPDNVETGPSFEGASGYLNLDSGWALAARGVEVLTARVIALGGKVVGGKAVAGLIREAGVTSGVTLADGSSIGASLVVIASGSWTASTFRDLDLAERCASTG
jgi:sarcosine oxidase/L-pipecolate oxidase